MLSALLPDVETKKGYYPRHYKQWKNDLNFDGIEFPVFLEDIPKFESQNPVSINIYLLKRYGEKYSASPYHLTNEKKYRHVNLLILQDKYAEEEEEEEDCYEGTPNFHYVWIRCMSALIRKDRTKHDAAIHVCDRCMNQFTDRAHLENHEKDCSQVNNIGNALPNNNEKFCKFRNFNSKERLPIILYTDFESLLKPKHDDPSVEQIHQAYSVGFYLSFSHDPKRSRYESYRQTDEAGKSPADWFIDRLVEIKDEAEAVFNNMNP